MQFRKHNWLNTTTLRPIYGIQARLDGDGYWRHASDNGKFIAYDIEADRDAKLKELRKAHRKPRKRPYHSPIAMPHVYPFPVR